MEIAHHFTIVVDSAKGFVTVYQQGLGVQYLVELEGHDPFYIHRDEAEGWHGDDDHPLAEKVGAAIDSTFE